MSRVKIPADFPDQERIRDLSDRAFRAYLRLVFYMARYVTHYRGSNVASRGVVLDACHDNRAVVRELTKHGLLTVTEDGYAVDFVGIEVLPEREPIRSAARAAVLAEWVGRPCGICGQTMLAGQSLHIDHVLAVKRGGSSSMENLRLTHSACNTRKGARGPDFKWTAEGNADG